MERVTALNICVSTLLGKATLSFSVQYSQWGLTLKGKIFFFFLRVP